MKSMKSTIGRWVFFIFGLVFFLTGLGVGYSTIGMMTIKYFSSTDWESVPASISSLELEQFDNDGSSTYRVDASYSYYFQGDRQNTSVTFTNTADNIGTYWQELFKKLKQDQENDRAIAWVNPNNPSEAVLDRSYRWANVAFGSIFILMFGGFGFGAMWLSLKKVKPLDQERQEARINGISSQQKSGFWFLFLFGCPFFFIGLFTFYLVLPSVINEGEYAALMTLLFVFVGGGLMSFAYINQRRYKLIGPSPLFLDPLPGIIGGQVGGRFNVAFRAESNPVTIVLSCKKRIKRGKNSTTVIVWQESMQGFVEQNNSGMNISFLFDCPDNLPTSNSSSIFWNVSAESTLKVQSKEVKLDRSWNIPVEKTEAIASSINIPAQFLHKQSEEKIQQAQTAAADLINFNQQGHFLDVENISERPIGTSFGGLIFGLIFAGAGVFTITEDWWPGYFFVLIGSLVIVGSIFLLGRSIDVKIDTAARILYTRRRWFGIMLYKRELMLFEPSQFSMKKTSSTTSSKQLTQWYKIEVKNKDQQVLVAEGIKGKDVAQALLDNIIKKAFPQRY